MILVNKETKLNQLFVSAYIIFGFVIITKAALLMLLEDIFLENVRILSNLFIFVCLVIFMAYQPL